MADKNAAKQMLYVEYIKSNFSLNQDSWDNFSQHDAKKHTQEGLADCVLQLNAINSYGQEAKEAVGEDIWKMAKV